MTMFIADGYAEEGIAYWKDFAAERATTPPSLVLEDHPYPGKATQLLLPAAFELS